MLKTLNQLPRQFTWGLIFPIIFLNGWLLLLVIQALQPLVSILIAATLISFLLDFPIRFLQRQGVRRVFAIALVVLIFLLIVVSLGLFLIPLIFRQTNELLTKLPEWIQSGQQQFEILENWAVSQQLPIDVSTYITQLADKLTNEVRSLTKQIFSIVFGAIGSLVNVILTLAFVLFLVLRGESLWNGILGWFPEQWNQQIRQSLPQNFERYIVGQVTLAAILAILQTIALLVLKVPLAQLFGLGIGAASLIPIGGITATLLVSLLLGLQNFWLGIKFLAIALIVIQINDNVVAPRLVGELVGLNPIWMLISLFVGVKFAGILGLVVTVPIAGFLKATFDTLRTSMNYEPLKKPSSS
jgi:predicted PurR-regulated permease PerM